MGVHLRCKIYEFPHVVLCMELSVKAKQAILLLCPMHYGFLVYFGPVQITLKETNSRGVKFMVWARGKYLKKQMQSNLS